MLEVRKFVSESRGFTRRTGSTQRAPNDGRGPSVFLAARLLCVQEACLQQSAFIAAHNSFCLLPCCKLSCTNRSRICRRLLLRKSRTCHLCQSKAVRHSLAAIHCNLAGCRYGFDGFGFATGEFARRFFLAESHDVLILLAEQQAETLLVLVRGDADAAAAGRGGAGEDKSYVECRVR